MKKYIVIVLFLINSLHLFSETIDELTSPYYFQNSWKISFTNDVSLKPSEITGWYQDDDITGSYNETDSGGNEYLWLTNSFSISKVLDNRQLTVEVGQFRGSLDIWFNDKIIYRHGYAGDIGHYPKNVNISAQIPPHIIEWDKQNTISVRFYSDKKVFPSVPEPFIADYQNYRFTKELSDFVKVQLYLAFCVLSLFIAIYFSIQYFYNRSEKYNLWLMLANISLSIYFFEMGITMEIIPHFLMYLIGKSMLTLFFMFLTLYIIEYFNILNNRIVKILILLTELPFSILYFVVGTDFVAGEAHFNLALMPAGVWLIVIWVVSLIALLRKKMKANIIFVGVTIGILAAVHDFYYSFSEIDPFLWLQGVGIVLFDISIFFTQSMGAIQNIRDLKASSFEIENKQNELSTYLLEINQVSNSVAEMSYNLDENIKNTTETMDRLNVSTQDISSQVHKEFALALDSGHHIKLLTESSEVVLDKLSHQGKDIDDTSTTIELMLNDIKKISEDLEIYSQNSKELEILAKKGEDSMNESTRSINEIKVVSENIYQVVEAMNDVSERTNLLSMNASIEAAHAGESGKGFAVVASEIKKLASNSSQKAAEVISEVDNIRSKITEGVKVNQNVNNILKEISEKMRYTVQQIQTILKSLISQKESSENIKGTLSKLNSSSAEMRQATDNQRKHTQQMSECIDNLMEASKVVLSGIQEIVKENETLMVSTESLENTSTRGKEETRRLKELLEEE